MQASDLHIMLALQAIEALAVPNATGLRWCVIDRCTRADALETLLLTCIELGQALDQVDADALLHHLAQSSDDFSCVFSPLVYSLQSERCFAIGVPTDKAPNRSTSLSASAL
jgi:hypothetical protein